MIGDADMHAMLAAAVSAEPPQPEVRVRRVKADTAQDEARARWDMILQQPVTKQWLFDGPAYGDRGYGSEYTTWRNYDWTEFRFGYRSGPPGFPPPGSPAGKAAPKVACQKLWGRMLPWEKGQSFKEAIAAVADVNHLSFWLDRLGGREKRPAGLDTPSVWGRTGSTTTGYVLRRLSDLDPDKYTGIYIKWLFAWLKCNGPRRWNWMAQGELEEALDNWKEVARIGDTNYKGAHFVNLMSMALTHIVRISKLLGQDCAEYEERLNSEFPPGEAATEPPAGAETDLPVV